MGQIHHLVNPFILGELILLSPNITERNREKPEQTGVGGSSPGHCPLSICASTQREEPIVGQMSQMDSESFNLDHCNRFCRLVAFLRLVNSN